MSDLASLWLGSHRRDAKPVSVAPSLLLRHFMALGSSGSGKTVLCKVVVEEAVRAGVPVLAVDPQGDLGSLLLAGDAAELTARGVDPALAATFHDKVDVVVFSPGASKGVPVSIDPVPGDLAALLGSDRQVAITRAAANMTSLLGYDLDSDDGGGVCAVLDRALSRRLDRGASVTGLASLAEELGDESPNGTRELERLLPLKKIRTATQRLARLDVGARRPLFHEGVPLDIDVLLGRHADAAPPAGKTRVAVLHLNSLHAQEDKEFVVAALVDRLYAWMLRHPSPSLQALFYIDEIAPFMPPVSKPACKEGLVLLFKQARKYGIGCLMATQNPGDIDYKAMAQFGTWAIGRVTTRQDLKKLEPTVRALAPTAGDDVIGELPSLKPGEFSLLAPDAFPAPVPLRARWLLSRHRTLDDATLEDLARAWRPRFARLERGAVAPPAPTRPTKTIFAEPVSQAFDVPSPAPPHAHAPASESNPGTGTGTTRGTGAETAARALAPPLTRALALLSRSPSLSARELATAASISDTTARAQLKKLTSLGLATSFKEGSSSRYFARATGARPDLALPATAWAVHPQLDPNHATARGRELVRSNMLGLLGEPEILAGVELIHRLVYRVDFEELVETSVLRRLWGPAHDRRLGSVYVHPHSLEIVVFRPGRGIARGVEPGALASDVEDFDGVVHFYDAPTAQLSLDADDVRAAHPPDAVATHFRKTFAATPGAVRPVFLPFYRLTFRTGAGSGFRVLLLDGLAGEPIDWPAPRA